MDVKLDIVNSSDSLLNVTGSQQIEFEFDQTQNVRFIYIRDDSLCFADTSLIDPMKMVVYNYPEANAGSDAEVCGLSHTLTAVPSGTGGHWNWEGSFVQEPSSPVTPVTAEEYRNYLFLWVDSIWNCLDTDTVSVTFFEQPLSADAGPDQALDFEFESYMNASPPEVGQGKWTVSSGDGYFENDTLHNTFISGITYLKNVYKWTVYNGACIPVSDSLSLIVNPLELPKGFTPDGDGKNDEFIVNIEHAEKLKCLYSTGLVKKYFVRTIILKNRFGAGKIKKGADLPEGTYFYVITAKVRNLSESFVFKSYIELLRK
ncbi:MAG: hypothetical protein HC906_02410 [Bacteroidales bacterium]|nr:hypothetical protein [Bacteroidales bacterium]